jgi:hypothetical protein
VATSSLKAEDSCYLDMQRPGNEHLSRCAFHTKMRAKESRVRYSDTLSLEFVTLVKSNLAALTNRLLFYYATELVGEQNRVHI